MPRLRRLEQIDLDTATSPAGRYRLGWLPEFIETDRTARREFRRLERFIDEFLDCHGTTLRGEDGIGTISAANPGMRNRRPPPLRPQVQVRRMVRHRRRRLVLGRPHRRPRQTPVPLHRQPGRQLNAAHSVGQPAVQQPHAAASSPANPPKATPDEKPDETTNVTSPTESSAECGATNKPENNLSHPPLDKGASENL